MISDRDYKTLASVRAELRSFAHFTEQSTSHAGLTPQQHQILLAIRASETAELTIGELAEIMLLKPHSVSGIADRLQKLDLVERVRRKAEHRASADAEGTGGTCLARSGPQGRTAPGQALADFAAVAIRMSCHCQ